MNEVEDIFKTKAILKGEMLLFSKENALLFIEECKNKGIPIIGIDAFHAFDIMIQPSSENSIDFSSSSYKSKTGNTYLDAAIFLKDKDTKLIFEVVCAF